MRIYPCLILVLYQLNIFLVNANFQLEKALVFNRKRYPSLIYVPEKGESVIKRNSYWVFACPAETVDQIRFRKKYSFYNAALFVEKHYSWLKGDRVNVSDLRINQCLGAYELSMAWFKETLEFGYEIYFERSQLVDSNFVVKDASDYDEYERLNFFVEDKPLSFIDRVKSLYATTPKEKTADTELKMNDKEMEFIWIPLIKVWIKANRIRRVEYLIRTDNLTPTLECRNYRLGKELLYKVNVDDLYSKKNQEKILQGLQLPSQEAYNGCEDEFKCLSKWLLIPSDQFEFAATSSSKPECSNLVTVPIWTSTLEGILKKLDIYLYALAKITGERLRIVAGVSGILKLPYAGLLGKVLSSYVILEKEKFPIRAPNIIYKIVKFETIKCRIKDTLCWYGVLIVIHNDPYYDGVKKICNDVTDEFGWGEIRHEDFDLSSKETPSKYIYACRITLNSIEAIGLTYQHDLIMEDLSLKEFPVSIRVDGKVDFEDVGVKIDKELERMDKNKESLPIEDRIVERPAIYDENYELINDFDDLEAEKKRVQKAQQAEEKKEQ